MPRGGKRIGAGRKPKDVESDLIEKLSAYEEDALAAIIEGVKNKDFKYVQLYMNYLLGKPKETKDISVNEDLPLFID